MTQSSWNPEQLSRDPITTEAEVESAFRAEAITDLTNLKPIRIINTELYNRLIDDMDKDETTRVGRVDIGVHGVYASYIPTEGAHHVS